MRMGAEESNVVMLAGVQGVAVFTSLLPAVLDVKRATPTTHPHVVEALRIAEFTAAAITVSVGTMVSLIAGSWMPVMVSMLLSAVVIGIYELLLRSEPDA